MINFTLTIFFAFQLSTGSCQLTRVDQFGFVGKTARQLKMKPVKVNEELPEEQKLTTLPHKKKDISLNHVVRLFKHLKTLAPTSGFGNHIYPITGEFKYHTGIDYKAFYEPVYNIADGRVIKAGSVRGGEIIAKAEIPGALQGHICILG